MSDELWTVTGPQTIDVDDVHSLKLGIVKGRFDVVSHDEPFVRIEVTGELSWVLLLAAAVGAPLGDVIASMVKRHAGVKDAGTWLPGFGGLLDRADSLLVVAPLFSVTLAVS